MISGAEYGRAPDVVQAAVVLGADVVCQRRVHGVEEPVCLGSHRRKRLSSERRFADRSDRATIGRSAVNAERTYDRTTAARSRGRQPEAARHTLDRASGAGVQPLQRLVIQLSPTLLGQ